jgi:hypothetical protein
MPPLPPPIITSEILIVDDAGQARLVMSATSGEPRLEFLSPNGRASASVALDAGGRPRIALQSPDSSQPSVSVEVDDKGAHVRFDRPAEGSSYLFLNNAGVSGVVLIDAKNVRRVEVVLAPDGTPKIRRYDAHGRSLP